MPATPITAATRYIPAGIRDFYWVATIANKAAPTRSELNAGTDLSDDLMSVEGFELEPDIVDAPDYGSRVVSQIPGRVKLPAPKINMYMSSNSTDARTLFTDDLNGFIVILLEGDVSTRKMDVWPVRVNSTSPSQGDADPAVLAVSFVVTSVPARNVTVPA